MSIPKEPRQLMINIMYLVLTAMLALNVSAEIINAFFALDKGNQDTAATIKTQLDATQEGLNKLLAEEAKADFRPIQPAVEKVRSLAQEFNGYVNALRDELIDAAGNNNKKLDDADFVLDHGSKKPKGKKNKDVTTRLLVNQGKGEALKAKILETRQAMLDAYSALLKQYGEAPFGLKQAEVDARIANMTGNLTLNVDDEEWRESKDKSSWADYKFRQMPLAAVLPILSKMQADATTAEAALVNNMAELAGGRTISFDSFFPVVNAKKSYVIAGEPFEAEISVGTYSSQINPSDIRIIVDGQTLTVNNEGKAEFKASTGSPGVKTLKLRAEVRNPLTGKVADGETTFEYEVGQRSVAVAADQMNVFYIGVPNPITISAAGTSSNTIRVEGSGGGIDINGSGSKRVVNVTQPGEATVFVSGDGLKRTPFKFRVKRIPDPVAFLGRSKGGAMGNGEFKAQEGLIARLDNFDFDAKCDIQGYELVYIAKREDPVDSSNPGGRFNEKSQRLVARAKPGDTYYFNNIKAKCPGDKAGRDIGTMAFTIR